jgi:hypothetical protein
MLLDWPVRITLLALMLPIPSAGRQVTRSYIDEGERHYAAVLGRPPDPCSDDRTVSHEVCMDKELTFVEPHLDGFVAALRGVLTARAASSKSGAQSELETLNKQMQHGGCTAPKYANWNSTISRAALGRLPCLPGPTAS